MAQVELTWDAFRRLPLRGLLLFFDVRNDGSVRRVIYRGDVLTLSSSAVGITAFAAFVTEQGGTPFLVSNVTP